MSGDGSGSGSGSTATSASGTFTESIVEEAALTWLRELGYAVRSGPSIAPGEPAAERASFGDVVLVDRLRAALARLNPTLPAEALDDAVRQVLHASSPSLIERNRHFHSLLVNGVDVEYRRPDGSLTGGTAWLVDYARPEANDWLAVNQLTVIEGKAHRRPDIVLYVNGLPLAVIELKNPADEHATLRAAYNQLQTYQRDIPALLAYSEVLVISDGVEARAGTLGTEWARFAPWRTVDGTTLAPTGAAELAVLLQGMCAPARFLDLVRHFIVFESDGAEVIKKVAAYHQYHAVNAAVAATLRAASPSGDRRIGVVWHTQGSGKSLSMAFYAGKVIQQPAMANPTLVVITDRNDLDDQLFGTFSRCAALLHQQPVQAADRAHLRELLRVASGGVIFTTLQKFLPPTVTASASNDASQVRVAEERPTSYPAAALTDRRNVIVITDEAHRSQYDFIDGFARHLRDALPNASFIGFTGTPIETTDRNTRAVFGDYLDVYDLQRAVEDGATVPIYYEGRLAKLELNEAERPKIDPDFEELTEGEEVSARERLKSKWARLEAMVGTEQRLGQVAADIVEHFEARRQVLEGKAMVVCMSRRICVDLYHAIVRLRPEWHTDDDASGAIKVVMTGAASDPLDWQPHIRNKAGREALATRFKQPDDPLMLVLVRDMWLTGFDNPCLHTMYVDKPMRGQGLMQAIARVNRVFKDKPGGLIVDYLGLADQLRQALLSYSEGDRHAAGIPQEEAVYALQTRYDILTAMLHGFDRSRYWTGTPQERLATIPAAREHILALSDGTPDENRKRFVQQVDALSKAFALAVPDPRALALRDDVGFFQTVRAAFVKTVSDDGRSAEDLDSAIRQLVSRAVAPAGVVDIFAAAGLQRPDISVLSDEFLDEVRRLPYHNVALELLQKLLNDELKTRARRNVVESRKFSELLQQALVRYQNRTIEAAQVIAELIQLAKTMREAQQRGQQLGMSDEELAFYDAVAANASAVQVLGDATLRLMARELVALVRQNATIDWTLKEQARARLRTLVKRLLRQHGYPPDQQEQATQTVIQQAELFSREWVA
jgi:type I restriction enzyme R subunit